MQAYIELVHSYMPRMDLHPVLAVNNNRDGSSGQTSLLLYLVAGWSFLLLKSSFRCFAIGTVRLNAVNPGIYKLNSPACSVVVSTGWVVLYFAEKPPFLCVG